MPANGAPPVGLMIGSILGPRSIAHSTYIVDKMSAAAYYTESHNPTADTLKAYYNRTPVYPSNDKIDLRGQVVEERVSGSCLRPPYGHAHPRTFNLPSWSTNGSIGADALYGYCEKRSSAFSPDAQFVFCGRDKMNVSKRTEFCTKHETTVDILTTGGSILYADRSPCAVPAKSNIAHCLFFNGDDSFPSVESVLNHVPASAVSAVLYVAPFTAEVAWAFKFDATQFDISKRDISKPGHMEDRGAWLPVSNDRLLLTPSASSQIMAAMKAPGPDTPAALEELNARALRYRSYYASNCS